MNYKHKANMALVISVIFFCVCVVLRYFYREVFIFKLMLFVSEASLVGGIADWFAVTALFTKPLGIPYHTEIIPRNRKSIINSTANLVERDLLSKETLEKHIGNISVGENIVKYVDNDKAIKEKCIDKLTKTFINSIYERNVKDISGYIEKIIKEEGKNINLSEMLKDFVNKKFVYESRGKWAQDYLDKLSEEEGNEKILAFAEKIFNSKDEDSSFSISSLLNKLNVSFAEDLAAIIKSQLQKVLTELVKEDSELSRVWANNFVKSLDGFEISQASIEEWKFELLEKTDFKPIIEAQLPVLINEGSISGIVEKLWDYFKDNDAVINAIDNGVKKIILTILDENHKVIGNIARSTLDSFTDEKLNQFVEDKAGEDLQWIRINGSVLGGCIGLVLFLFLNLIYEPIVRGLFL